MILRDLGDVLSARLDEGTPGDPGLIGPDGQVWRVAREKVVLAGGPAALLLQLAHPLVAAGVADHSEFESQPLHRLAGTLTAVLTATFGDRHQAEAVGRRVAAVHTRVTGTLSVRTGPFPAGAPYRAADPDLALWIQATLVKVAIDIFDCFVEPLSHAERAQYYDQTKPIGRLFSVTDDVMPATYADFERYVDTMEHETLAVGDDARSAAAGVLRPKLGPAGWLARPLTRLLATAFLPDSLRAAYGLHWRRRERAAFAVTRASIRTALAVLPGRWRYWPHERTALDRVRQTAGTGTDAGTGASRPTA
ncbi:MAG: hypothetical protein QOJ69_2309 [Actinomycetota bacterium]|nr:hypothetical protein [Actinomycetota bacterium]